MISSKPFIVRLMLVVFLINLSVLILLGFSLRQSYRHYQEQAEINSQNLAKMLAIEISGHIRTIDELLIELIEEYQEKRTRGIERKEFSAHLERVRARLPEIDALRITNAQGTLVVGTDVAPETFTSLADRPHFILLRDNPKAGLVISKPQVSRVNQKWVIVLGRRINQRGGAFDGIAFAAISLEQLSRTFSLIQVGPHGNIALRDGDLGFIAYYPAPPKIDNIIGYTSAPERLRDMIQAGHKTATFVDSSIMDGVERTYSHRQIDSLPLYVDVGLAVDDYFAEWRRQSRQAGELALLFVVVTLISSWLIYRGWREQKQISDRLEIELAERKRVEAMLRSERDFAEGLIDTAQTIVLVLDADGKIVRINPYLEGISGYSLDEVQGKDWFDTFLPAQIRVSTRALFLSAINNGQTDGNVNAIVNRDGQERLIEWHNKALKDVDGSIVGLLAVGLDVTERNTAEQQILQYQNQLEEMVKDRTKELVTAMERLQEVECRERAMLRKLPVGVRLSSNDGNKTLFVNPCFVEMFGYTLEDIPSLAQWWPLAYPDPAYRAWAVNEWAWRMATARERHGDSEPLEVQIVAKDGTVKYIRIHASVIGALNFVTFIDMSERKWAENALVTLNDSLAQRVAERTESLMQKTRILEEEIKNRRKLEINLLLISEEERLAIGSELHDNVGQTLTAIGFFASALFGDLSRAGSPSSQKAKYIAELVGEATRTVRYLSNGLIQFDIARQGLQPSLSQLASDVSRVSGIPCEFRCSGCEEITDFAIVTHLFRIAQEALNNSLKHSSAHQLSIDLQRNDREIRLIVMDDGVGCPSCREGEGKSRGLLTMDYRAKLIGASLSIAAAKPRGTVVTVIVPVNS